MSKRKTPLPTLSRLRHNLLFSIIPLSSGTPDQRRAHWLNSVTVLIQMTTPSRLLWILILAPRCTKSLESGKGIKFMTSGGSRSRVRGRRCSFDCGEVRFHRKYSLLRTYLEKRKFSSFYLFIILTELNWILFVSYDSFFSTNKFASGGRGKVYNCYCINYKFELWIIFKINNRNF